MAKTKSSVSGKQHKKIVPVKGYTKKMVLKYLVTDVRHQTNKYHPCVSIQVSIGCSFFIIHFFYKLKSFFK